MYFAHEQGVPTSQACPRSVQALGKFVTACTFSNHPPPLLPQAGSLGITGFCVVGLGLPYILLVAPMMLWRCAGHGRGERSGPGVFCSLTHSRIEAACMPGQACCHITMRPLTTLRRPATIAGPGHPGLDAGLTHLGCRTSSSPCWGPDAACPTTWALPTRLRPLSSPAYWCVRDLVGKGMPPSQTL